LFGTPFTAQVSNKDGADVSNLFGAPFTAQVSNKDACMMAAHTFVLYTLHCTGVKQGRMHDGGSHVCLVHPSLHRCQTRTVQM